MTLKRQTLQTTMPNPNAKALHLRRVRAFIDGMEIKNLHVVDVDYGYVEVKRGPLAGYPKPPYRVKLEFVVTKHEVVAKRPKLKA